MSAPTTTHRYYLVGCGEIIHEGDSAIDALAAFHERRTDRGEPLICTFDGAALRAHTLHELEWDADAEEKIGDPTHYWPKAGERGPFLRQVV